MNLFGSSNLDLKNKEVLITGGSQGLGEALAILLSKRGANVTIAARDESKLKLAFDKIQVCIVRANVEASNFLSLRLEFNYLLSSVGICNS